MSIFNYNLFFKKSQLVLLKNSQNKGFLLLELSIALLAIIILTMFMVSLYINFTNGYNQSVRKLEAIIYASNILEYMRTGKKLDRNLDRDNFKVKIRSFTIGNINNFEYKLVKVSWILNGKTDFIELGTGILT